MIATIALLVIAFILGLLLGAVFAGFVVSAASSRYDHIPDQPLEDIETGDNND